MNVTFAVSPFEGLFEYHHSSNIMLLISVKDFRNYRSLVALGTTKFTTPRNWYEHGTEQKNMADVEDEVEVHCVFIVDIVILRAFFKILFCKTVWIHLCQH